MAVIIDSEDMSNLGPVVRFHRGQSGLSRVALAELAGVGKTAIYDIEHGKVTVRLETLAKVMAVLNIAIELSSPLMDLYEEHRDEAR